jgi:hypothetical protein
MPTISGTVYDGDGLPAAGRTMRAYRRDTGELLDQTTTSAAVTGDPDYDSVELLLKFEESEGSTTFADSSTNALSGSGNALITQLDGPFPGTGCLDTNGGASSAVSSTTLFDVPADQPYTLEFFMKLNSLPSAGLGFATFFQMGSLYGDVTSSGGLSIVHVSSQSFTSPIIAGQWYHIAISKQADGTRRVFLDGVASTTQSVPVAIDASEFRLGITNPTYSPNARFAQVRLTIGIARYTSSFTSPTTPFATTSVSSSAGEYSIGLSSPDDSFGSVQLLLKMDGANASTTFTDSSGTPKTITRFGNTQISTAQSKFGGASAYFDGTGDYLTVPYTTAAFDWWTEDFTLECWVYAASFSTWSNAVNLPALIGNVNPGGSLVDYWSFGPVSTNFLRFHYFNGGSSILTSTNELTTSAWNHIALTKSGTTIRLFVNGVQGASATVSGTPQSSTSQPLAIGQNYGRSLDGYVDDLRITKGVARYTANFTPTTEPFPDENAYVGECNVVCLDDPAGTVYNDLILRTTPI